MTGSVYGHDTTWKAFDEKPETLGLDRAVRRRVENLLKQRLRDVYRATWSCSRDRAYVASRVRDSEIL